MEREHPSPFENTDTGLDTDIMDLPLVRKPTWSLRTLYQTEHWINISGETIPLEKIDAGYARNIMAFLDRHAPKAHERAGIWFEGELHADLPDGVFSSLTSGLSDHYNTDPLEWMRATPLYQVMHDIVEPPPVPVEVHEITTCSTIDDLIMVSCTCGAWAETESSLSTLDELSEIAANLTHKTRSQ